MPGKKNKSVKKQPKRNKSVKNRSANGPKLTWIEHLKMYSRKHNMKYGDAMKDKNCLALYHESR